MSCLRLLGAVGVVLMLSTSLQAGLAPERLRCEYVTNPLGIDIARPRLSWVLESAERAQKQTAYQVLVASSADRLKDERGDLWDSGKVAGAETLHIEYAGQPLQSGQRVWWTVRVWDVTDSVSRYGPPAWFEMALLRAEDWAGKWITRGDPAPAAEEDLYKDDPSPLFRKEFAAPKRIRQARAYVTGLGYYELRLNGRRVGDHLLDPGWTTYSKRVLYSTYDVTPLLRQGRNAVGLMVGNGWYNPLPLRMWGHINPREHLTVGRPRAILQLNIEYEDGTRESVVTDETWQVGASPILRNNVYLGEVYDARREQPGWDEPVFEAPDWKAVAIAKEPVGPLRAQAAPPIRETRRIKPVSVKEPKPGVFIFDMGQNFAGWVTLHVRGESGTKVVLRYGELLYPDGTLNPMTSVCGQIKRPGVGGPGAPDVAWQSETYICKGVALEKYTPRFTFRGFRYVEVTGYPGRPTPDVIEGHRLNTDIAPAGEFECSNPMFNRLQEVVRWTLLSNLFSVQSDCPHREKFGYGGDIIASSDMVMLNYDVAAFYRKTTEDHADAARENGGITETAPFVGIADDGFGGGSGPIGWGSAHPVLTWQLYQYCGDRRLVEEQYETAQRWLSLLERSAKDHIIEVGISDHESIAPKPVQLTGTAFYWYNTHLLSKLAKILGRTEDAKRYDDLGATIRDAFNRKFLKEGGVYDQGTQACQAFALFMNLVPSAQREAALKVLVEDVKKNKDHLTTGIFGTKFMLRVLTDLGRADVAYAIANQKTFPGWGHMLEGGATTLWEHWAFSDNTYSHNHPMFGSVSEWFFRAVAGIQPDDEAVGFDRVTIRPCIVGDLTWAKGAYDSVRGLIHSEWRKDDSGLSLQVIVPTGVTATVHIPRSGAQKITEDGRPLDEAKGVRVLRRDPGATICELGGGRYAFRVRP